jgi:hypothetical protein
MKKIKLLLGKIETWIKSTLEKGDKFIRKNGEVAVKVTQALKNAVESNIVKTIVELTPTDLDDRALFVAQKILPKVAFHVALGMGLVKETSSPEEAVKALQEYLQGILPDGRAKFWADFAAVALVFLQDGKISWREGNILTQMYYEEFYGNKLRLV